MSRASIFVILWSLTTCSLGFTMDRSALVLSTWDMAPSLDTYQRISVDPTLNNKTQTTGTVKLPQAGDVKVLTKVKNGMLENQTRERRSTTENIGAEIKPISDLLSTVKNEDSVTFEQITNTALRNVILLFVDDKDHNEKKSAREHSWQSQPEMLSFSIEGLLQSCENIETSTTSLKSVLIENKEKYCDCERRLNLNMEKLLFWAKHTKRMATGLISANNFSSPLLLDYIVTPNNFSTEIDGFSEGNTKQELRRNRRTSNDEWQMIDLGDREKSIFIPFDPEFKRDETINYGAWDIFDVFSKIRMAFFRSLLETLGKKDGTSEEKFSSRESFALQSTVTNLIGSLIRNLKFISGEKGYVLIAIVPRSERIAAVNFLRSEISADTLLVVTETCSGSNRSVIPFAARGPNCQILREVRTIWELPMTIENAFAESCHGLKCSNRQRRDVPVDSSMKIDISTQEFPARTRVIRDKNVTENQNTTSTVEPRILEKPDGNSTPLEAIPNIPSTLLGVAVSLLIVAVLTPS